MSKSMWSVEPTGQDTNTLAGKVERAQVPIMDLARGASTRHGTGIALDALLGAYLQISLAAGMDAATVQAALRNVAAQVPGMWESLSVTHPARVN